MSELSGTLQGVGLPAIVHFLGGLKKTGCLHITHENLRGDVFFDRGLVSGANLGSRRGLSALDGLVESMPEGSFSFESDTVEANGPSIDLSPAALEAHLDELTSRAANGTPHLPPFDAIPNVVQQGSDAAEEPLPLDRGTLQTLLAVDGQRTVREVVAQRATLEALWQLATLAELGLIALSRSTGPGAAAPLTSSVEPAPHIAPQSAVTPAAPIFPQPRVIAESRVAPQSFVAPAPRRPIALDPTRQGSGTHCSKLGFEDDPSNSFSRPTRLHRCFAAGAPLPLSLDQQRELCLGEQFDTCPRLTIPVGADPRVVRLPFVARTAAAEQTTADQQAVGGNNDPARLRPSAVPLRNLGGSMPPTPLRSRVDRSVGSPATGESVRPSLIPTPLASAAAAVADPPPSSIDSPPIPQPKPGVRQVLLGQDDSARLFGIPMGLLASGAVAVLVIGALAFLLLPLLGDLSADDSINPTALPTSSALLNSGAAPQFTPQARPTAPTNASAASAATAAPQATLPPEPTTAQAAPAAPAAASGEPAPTPTLLDERFTTNSRNWPSSAQGTAQWGNGTYRIMTRQAGQFVAIGAPIADVLQDVIVSATFHKVSGPSGGGYGIILRDQASTPESGTSQDGRYYVVEVGDKGEYGMWRRDGDHWVDLAPWQRSDAVKSGTGVNELTARATGSRLSLSVNGTQVVTRTDATYTSGGVGIFTGGDGNVVAVDKLVVQTP
ncbi:MAG TPA: DUF4388 domain-containing protein [Chloroflexota bacterium]|jgi:hypothetical protein|nr:DUF4388 domain-containing protein [Chloroflexota bacterium]